MRYEATAEATYRIVKVNRWTGIVTVECQIPGVPPSIRRMRVGDTINSKITLKIYDVPPGLQMEVDDGPGLSWSYHA